MGTGKNTTRILGEFRIENLENITFKEMTVTNTSHNGCGIRMSNAKVELFDVALKGCGSAGFFIPDSSSETTFVATRCNFANSRWGVFIADGVSAKFNSCLFHDNSRHGIFGRNSTIHLHGEATAIHSNGNGIYSYDSCKVIIHLPSHHNTSYNNGGQDRRTSGGGTITNVED